MPWISYTAKNQVPTADFRLFYDVGKGHVGARVLSYRPSGGEDGYFLMLASPEVKPAGDQPQKKTVIVVIDRSGQHERRKIRAGRM